MKTLIFITSRFPYEPGEAFIDSEFPFLCSAFDRKIIITRNVSGKKLKTIPHDVKVYRHNPASSLKEFIQMEFLVLRNFKKIDSMISEEMRFRKETGRKISLVNKLLLFKAIIKSLQLRDFIARVIKIEKPEGDLVLYSYWMNTGARAICMLDKIKATRISRAHRVELYEEEAKHRYLPLVSHTFHNLNALFFISEHGKRYFENRFGLVSEKNIVSRLGVINRFPFNPEIPERDFFRIVSCSSLINVKRVHLLISALGLVRSPKKIIWNHFGEGPLEKELKALAEETIGNLSGVEYKFMGRVMNAQIMEFYNTNNVDLLINTSSSEGIPVSIMEAQSFGIPVIATDTGGTAEIITKETGILLPVDFDIAGLARKIEYLLNLDLSEKARMKREIYDNWHTNFNAFTNFEKFIGDLDKIVSTDKT